MKIASLLLVFSLIVSCKSTKTTSNNSQTSTFEIRLDQKQLIIEKTKEFPVNTQLSIALINDKHINYYGILKTKDSIVIVENQGAVFEIGSVTKVFTATLLADYVIEKRLKMNDEINKYFSFTFNNDTKFTFQELANHTSGLARIPILGNANIFNPYKDYGTADLDRLLQKEMNIVHDFVPKYSYSNLGAGLLGYSLQKIENKSYEQLLNEKIFSKYGMTNSSSKREKLVNKLVKGLDYKGDEVPNWDLNALEGAGAILSTTEDLSKFVIAQFDQKNKALALTRKKTFSVNENMDIGLGWHIIHKEKSTLYWHNGGTGGYTSSLSFDIQNKKGVVILSNVTSFHQNSSDLDDLCFELMKM